MYYDLCTYMCITKAMYILGSTNIVIFCHLDTFLKSLRHMFSKILHFLTKTRVKLLISFLGNHRMIFEPGRNMMNVSYTKKYDKYRHDLIVLYYNKNKL